jgi:hypothetical protein
VHVWFTPSHDHAHEMAGFDENAFSVDARSMVSFHSMTILVSVATSVAPLAGMVLTTYGGERSRTAEVVNKNVYGAFMLFPARSLAEVSILIEYVVSACSCAIGAQVCVTPVHDHAHEIAGVDEKAFSADVRSMLSFHSMTIAVLMGTSLVEFAGSVLTTYGGYISGGFSVVNEKVYGFCMFTPDSLFAAVDIVIVYFVPN